MSLNVKPGETLTAFNEAGKVIAEADHVRGKGYTVTQLRVPGSDRAGDSYISHENISFDYACQIIKRMDCRR